MIGIYNDISFYNPNGGASYTVEGKQVHINGVENTSISNASVDMTPSQSFNGYDSPWPAGGGKNKLIITASGIKALNNLTWTNNSAVLNGITFTILEDAAGNVTGIRANGTASATAQITISKTNISQGIYYLSAEYYSSSAFVRGVFRDANNAAVSIGGSVFTDLTTTEAYRDVPSNVSYINIYININSGTTVNNVIYKPMLRVSTESSAYAQSSNICPISGTSSLNLYRRSTESGSANATYSQALGQTVYFGNFNYSTGKLTGTYALLTLTSSMSWSMQTDTLGNYRFYVPISGMKSNPLVDETMCTHFVRTTSSSYTKPFGNYYISGTGLYVNDGVNPEQSGTAYFSTLADFKTWLDAQNTAGTPVQILYPLATPTETTLSASTISVLTGDNYFDTNSTAANRFNVSMTYRDSMLYIKRPSDFAIEREDIYAGEYTTCTGSIKADRIGWKYKDTTINCDELTDEELSFFSGMSGATTFYFEDSDGSHSEQVIRTGFSNTPTRLTLPDGNVIWKNVGIGLRFIDAHND